jgi:phosphoribosyl transferase-like protein
MEVICALGITAGRPKIVRPRNHRNESCWAFPPGVASSVASRAARRESRPGAGSVEVRMRRTTSSAARGVFEVDWLLFGELCRALALRVARDYQPEVVLGVAKAGVIPGVVVASILQCDFASMVVTRRETESEPILVAGPPASIRGRRVLIVDETCDTGSTLRIALSEGRVQPRFLRVRHRKAHHPAVGPRDHPGRRAGDAAGLRGLARQLVSPAPRPSAPPTPTVPPESS